MWEPPLQTPSILLEHLRKRGIEGATTDELETQLLGDPFLLEQSFQSFSDYNMFHLKWDTWLLGYLK
jgi:hypothetical protein